LLLFWHFRGISFGLPALEDLNPCSHLLAVIPGTLSYLQLFATLWRNPSVGSELVLIHVHASLQIKQGVKYSDPKSAAELPAFIKLHDLNLDEVTVCRRLSLFRVLLWFFVCLLLALALRVAARASVPVMSTRHPSILRFTNTLPRVLLTSFGLPSSIRPG
jgi:hypothetical protein